MPFKNPGDGGQFVELDEGWYTAKVTDIEEKDGTRDFGKGVQPMVVWHCNLQDAQGNVVQDDRGFALDWWVITSQSLFRGKGMVSKGRLMAEAFLDREIDDDETGEDIGKEIIGKFALVFIGTDPKSGRPSSALTWKPRKKAAAAGRAAQRPAAPVAPPAQDSLEDVPF